MWNWRTRGSESDMEEGSSEVRQLLREVESRRAAPSAATPAAVALFRFVSGPARIHPEPRSPVILSGAKDLVLAALTQRDPSLRSG